MPLASALVRVQPCLFDRLIDLKPDENVESRAERVLSLSRYREGVLRDIQWLLNSSAHLEEEGLDDFPQVSHSVFNFGKRDISGLTASSFDPLALEEEITRAIRLFEPRIDPASVKVRSVAAPEASKRARHPGAYNCLTFEITGELWAHPAPEEFFLRTSLDVETGMQPVQNSP
jgi:type VI secretion system protein ImpF